MPSVFREGDQSRPVRINTNGIVETIDLSLASTYNGGPIGATTLYNVLVQDQVPSAVVSTRGVSIGGVATTTGNDAVAIGTNTDAALSGVALGVGAQATNTSAVAIGNATTATGTRTTAVGAGADATAASAVAMGDTAQATSTTSTAIGAAANASGLRASAVGNGCIASADSTLSVGDRANASALNAVAIGRQAVASGVEAVALGTNSIGGGIEAVAIGNDADALGSYSVALGPLATTDLAAFYGIALGWSATSTLNGICIGNSAAAGNNGIAIGQTTQAPGTAAIALGTGAQADAANCTAIGSSASVNAAATRGISIGQGNSLASAAANSVVIGPAAMVLNRPDTVAIGQGLAGFPSMRLEYNAGTLDVQATSLSTPITIAGDRAAFKIQLFSTIPASTTASFTINNAAILASSMLFATPVESVSVTPFVPVTVSFGGFTVGSVVCHVRNNSTVNATVDPPIINILVLFPGNI